MPKRTSRRPKIAKMLVILRALMTAPSFSLAKMFVAKEKLDPAPDLKLKRRDASSGENCGIDGSSHVIRINGQVRWLSASLAFTVAIAACTKATPILSPVADDGRSKEEVIYGDDNRADYYAETDLALRTLSESTVALISANQLGPEVGGLRRINGSNYGTSLGLCSDERFVEQNTAAFCSGFLVAPDIVVTAGHCVTDLKDCTTTSYAFGFALTMPGVQPTSLPASEVYSCKELIHSQHPSNGADFAIIRLDRPVANHRPLAMRTSGDVAVGDSLAVMGYPEGLPLKIAAGAAVRAVADPAFFRANLDTYGGNSGSAVVNTLTHEIEGVLVRGEQDFEWPAGSCARSYRCKDDACRGEDVTRISEVLKLLP